MIVLVVIALALAGTGLYHYESTRTVTCGLTTTELGGDLDANIARDPEGVIAAIPGQAARCRTRFHSARAEAQAIYIGYAVFVLLLAAACLLVERRRTAASPR
jgi:hypothetical protein